MNDDVVEEASLCNCDKLCVLLLHIAFLLPLQTVNEIAASLFKLLLDQSRYRLQLRSIRPPVALDAVHSINKGLCFAKERLLHVVSVYESEHDLLCLILSLIGLNFVQELAGAFDPAPHALLIVEAFEIP